ncbi:MAG: hypothetical protein K6G37_03530 [Bacilli bacterium]|nr:hypothetical protein [Bacilli bacterium]
MNKIVVTGTIIIIILMIGIPTYFNVKKDHEDKLIKVTEQKISTSAKQCFIENVCTGTSTTLDFLYENHYLERQTDPITKKYYDGSSQITYEDKKITLYLK